MVAACGLVGLVGGGCTWIGGLLESAAWLRFGGYLLVLMSVLVPVGLVAAVVGMIHGGGRNRWLYLLDFALLILEFAAAVLVHVGMTGGV